MAGRGVLRGTGVRLLAASPEDVYRIPQRFRPFTQVLPLPRYSTQRGRRRARSSFFKRLMAPPKPMWFNDMSQAKLYLSVLKYTEFQLTDERLYKKETYLPPALGSENLKDTFFERQIRETIVQPSFSELEPDQRYNDATTSELPHALQAMMEDLEKAGPALLPHPALALHGEALIKSIITDFLVDLFPRLHSNHLDSLVTRKQSLTNIVNAAVRCGMARGMGMSKETLLHTKMTSASIEIEKNQAAMKDAEEEIRRGAMTPDIRTPSTALFMAKQRLPKLGDDHANLLEDRMKLLGRHLSAFIAYASYVKGEGFAKAFVVRYFLPDIALQHFSSDPEMRAWLEMNNRWRFLPQEADKSLSEKSLVPRVSTADHVPMIVGGVETQSGVVAGSLKITLKSQNPMKELSLILKYDAVANQVFRDATPRYRSLFEGHKGVTGTKFLRVGVYAGSQLLAEGEGIDYEFAAKAAAQAALNSYYMNPKSNYLTRASRVSKEEPKEPKKRRKKLRRKKLKKSASEAAPESAPAE